MSLKNVYRTSRQRSADQKLQQEKEPAHVKLGVVARLRREVQDATSNKALAQMVENFGQVTNKSSGRTVTKVSLNSGVAREY
jgi:casein kinase 1